MSIMDLSSEELIRIRVNASALRGELCQELKELLKAHLARKVRHIHFSLDTVKFIDSMSIGMLLYFVHLQKRTNHYVRIESASEELKATLRTLALESLLT